MKAQDLAEKLLEYPRANVSVISEYDNPDGDITKVSYNPLTNDLTIEVE